ncbi:MAG: T9SS type A sorting domain-containing protein [Candidatus Neomarinimicrobiota bacterium]
MKKWITGLYIFVFLMTFAVGQDWEVVKYQDDPGASCIEFIDASTGFLLTGDDELWKTTDAGDTWTVLDTLTNAYEVRFANATVGYANAKAGYVYKTTDGGNNWSMIGDTAQIKINLESMWVLDADNVFFGGSGGYFAKTNDGGANFYLNQSANFNGKDLDDIAFATADVGVAINNSIGALTFYTADGGVNWTQVEIASIMPPGIASARIYSIAAAGTGSFLIGGYNYMKFLSTDGGQNYALTGSIEYGFPRTTEVQALDANTFFAAGTDGMIEKTLDGGTNWTAVKPPHGQGHGTNDMYFVDANVGFATADNGQWFKTSDGGENWVPMNDWPAVGLWGLAAPSDDKIIVGGVFGGEMTVTTDRGTTWSYPDNTLTGSVESFYAIKFADENIGYAAGNGGEVFKTTDGGTNWTLVENSFYTNAVNINSMAIIGADTLFIGGASGAFAYSYDGGANWSELLDFGVKAIYSIYALSGDKVILAAVSGYWWIYEISTATLTEKILGAGNFRDIEVRNDVMIVGSVGNIYRTTISEYDTLYSVYTHTETATDEFYDVEFITDSLVYAVGEDGIVMKSKDAGLSWTQDYLFPYAENLQACVFRNNYLWAVGGNGLIVKLDLTPDYELPIVEAATDGTFDLKWTINETAGAGSLAIVDSTGSAWGSHVIAYTDQGYTGIAHVDYAVFSDITISADIYLVGPADASAPLYAGITIRTEHSPLSYYRFIYRNSSSSDNGQLKLQGYDGAAWHISKAWNPGVDFTALETGWHNLKITVVGNDFYAFVDGELLPGCPLQDEAPFLTEGYPGVYVYNSTANTVMFDNFTVTEPEEIPEVGVGTEGLLPKTYALHQNYPNPFNPTTTIAFDMPQAGAVKVIVYNMVGQQVRTLVNDYVAAGTNYIIWDARDNYGRNLSSGVYLYQLVTDEKTITKRMVLLK